MATDNLSSRLAKLPRKDYTETKTKEWHYPASNSLDISDPAVQKFAYDLRIADANCIRAMNFGAGENARNLVKAHPNGRTFPVLQGRAFHSPDHVRTATAAWLKRDENANLPAPWVGSRKATTEVAETPVAKAS